MKQRLRDLEERDNWIEARVDELLDDEEWLANIRGCWIIADTCKTLSVYTHEAANSQATREHASLMADLEEALIDSGVRE